MDKRERVMAALSRKPVDRPPLSFWRHVPDVDHTAPGLAEAMLAFQRRWDLDFVKVMSSGVYCVEDWGCAVAYQGSPNGAKQCTKHAVQGRGDWARIRALDPGAGALGRELEAVRLIARGRADDAPILHTVFSPLTVARKLAGERLVEDLRQEPAAVEPALDAIAETMAGHARAAPRRRTRASISPACAGCWTRWPGAPRSRCSTSTAATSISTRRPACRCTR